MLYQPPEKVMSLALAASGIGAISYKLFRSGWWWIAVILITSIIVVGIKAHLCMTKLIPVNTQNQPIKPIHPTTVG